MDPFSRVVEFLIEYRMRKFLDMDWKGLDGVNEHKRSWDDIHSDGRDRHVVSVGTSKFDTFIESGS